MRKACCPVQATALVRRESLLHPLCPVTNPGQKVHRELCSPAATPDKSDFCNFFILIFAVTTEGFSAITQLDSKRKIHQSSIATGCRHKHKANSSKSEHTWHLHIKLSFIYTVLILEPAVQRLKGHRAVAGNVTSKVGGRTAGTNGGLRTPCD